MSQRGWKLLESELPGDIEQLAREHKALETQYGEAKLESARDLLRLIFLHTGADLALRQAVALMAESGGPKVSHVTLHKKRSDSQHLCSGVSSRAWLMGVR